MDDQEMHQEMHQEMDQEMDQEIDQPNLARAIREEQARNAQAIAVLEHREFIRDMRKFIKKKLNESYWDVFVDPGCGAEVAFAQAKSIAVKLEKYLEKRDLDKRIGSKFMPKSLCTIAAIKVINVTLADRKKNNAIKRQNNLMKETIYFMEDWYFNSLGREVNKYIGGKSGNERIPILTKYREEILEAGLAKYKECIARENCRSWSADSAPTAAESSESTEFAGDTAGDGEPSAKIARIEI